MNKINVDINFTKGTLIPSGIDLITGDYNSTEIDFTFDEEHQENRKVFEMKSPSEEIVMLEDIVDNKIGLFGLIDITTTHNDKTYIKYIKEDLIYWYQATDEKLYDSEWNEIAEFDLTEYTKVQQKASVFGEEGYYIFEVSCYGTDSKLTSVKGQLPVNKEQVVIDGEVVEPYLPIFDQIMQDVETMKEVISDVQEDITALQQDVDTLDQTKQDTLVSGENIKTINNESLLGSGNLEVITDLSDYYTKEQTNDLLDTKQDKSSMNEYYKKTETYSDDEVDTLLSEYTKTSDLGAVALSNDYDDLTDKPNLSIYSLITETGNKIDLEINSSTYVLTAKMYDKNNNLLSTSTGIDLPLETMVVGARYDDTTKSIILTLKNGQEVSFSVADLVSGLQTEITSDNMLSSDLVDDTGHTHKFVSSSDITNWNNKIDSSALTDYVKNTDYANSSRGGVVKITGNVASAVDSNGTLYASPRTYAEYSSGANTMFIGKETLENVITGKGLVSNTDYAANDKGGVIKTNSGSFATTTYNGQLAGITKDYTQAYPYMSTDGFITKGTLENVITGKELTNKTYVDSANEEQDTQIEELQEENTYLNNVISQLPKVNGTGETITLNNTIEAKMKSKLSPSELSQDGEPTLETPYDIHTTTGDNVIRDEGKNLFDISYMTQKNYNASGTELQNYYTNNNGILTISRTNAGSGRTFFNKLTLPSGTYTISFGTSASGSDKYFWRSVRDMVNLTDIVSSAKENVTNNYSFSFTINETKTIGISINPNDSNTGTLTITNIMLEKGNQATTYEPYQSQTYPITLGTLEYSKIGNYEDEFIYNTTDTNLELNKWYLKKNIGKVVLDGTETDWAYASVSQGSLFRKSGINSIALQIPVSNYFIGISDGTNRQNGNVYYNSAINTLDFIDNDFNDLGSFTSWLSTHNTIVYYVLDTPQYTLCNDTLQTQLTNIYNNMMSKKGTTNISQVNDDLPMVISASALLDLNTLIGD